MRHGRLFQWVCTAAACASIVSSRCGAPTQTRSPATLALYARILSPEALTKATLTGWDSLVVDISGADMPAMRTTLPLSPDVKLCVDTIHGIPAGPARTIVLSTISKAGIVVHRATAQTVDLAFGELKNLSFLLEPGRGSIYIQLADIPTSVDSIFIRFASIGDTIVRTASGKRNTRMNFSLDYIPDGIRGELTIAALDAGKDTLYKSLDTLTYHVGQSVTISAPFVSNVANLSLNLTIVLPGVTVVSGQPGSGDTVGTEQGQLVVTEIMYAADDSEYIELYNPKDLPYTFDTLVVQVDATKRHICGPFPGGEMTHTVPAKGFFVIGRKILSWADAWPSVASALDLSSTGNWITLRTKTMEVIDWVAFVAGTNDLGWPRVSGKTAIVLDALVSDPAYNNYGEHWIPATSTIGAAPGPQLGTPRAAGR